MKARVLLGLILSVLWCALAQADDDFATANKLYAEGDFRGAITGYESQARDGARSAALFYDLGNAYYRANDFGHAILNYQRALALDPHHPETLANLQLVRDKARALELRRDGFARLTSQFSAKEYAIALAIGFWIGAFALAGICFARRRSPALAGLLILSGIALLFFGYGLYASETGATGSSLAIVTAKNVDARLATAESAGTVLTLPPGSQIKILSTRGNWLYADLPNDLRGWIPTESAERVRL